MKRNIAAFMLILIFALSLTACQVNGVLGELTDTDLDLQTSVQPEDPEITEDLTLTTPHIPLVRDAYYQYSFLTEGEKAVYDRIIEAVQAGWGTVDVSDLSLPRERANEIAQKILTDNPQFFYLSKTISYTYSSDTNLIRAFQLAYTDGTTVDQYADGERTVSADRALISQQISRFNAMAEGVLGGIPADASALEKERMIHDYIISHTEYDTAAAQKTYESGEILPRAFDAYGALCEGKATCEGYSKLFQYLCYCAGINATQISGTADGGPHMWNAVCLDGVWYLIDVTWNDPVGLTVDVPVYDYFNLSAGEMNQDHVPDATLLSVPACESNAHSFYMCYAMHLTTQMGTPDNYEAILEYVAWNDEDYLMLYIGNLTGDLQGYVTSQFYDENSAVNRYISEQSLPLLFADSYITCGDYIYIPLE